MKTKKLIALILCASLLLSILFACDNPEDVDDDIDVEEEQVVEEPDIEPPKEGIDFEAAISTFPPDTVMIRSGDVTVTWAELYVFLFSAVEEILRYSPDGLDWSEEFTPGINLDEVALTYSTEEAISIMLFKYGAKVLGVTISDEHMIEHNKEIDALVEEEGGMEEFSMTLRENGGFYSLEVFESLILLEYTGSLIIIELYGENLEGLPDDGVADFIERYGFMMAKHILISSEENDSAREDAEDILKQLNRKINDDDFEEFFDSLMFEFSDDPGLEGYPQGYFFQYEEMVRPFSEACVELEIGQISEVVETNFGYHILLRLPVDFDSVPTGTTRSLRQLAAIEDFERTMREWRDELNPVFTPEYDSIDIATIFHWWES